MVITEESNPALIFLHSDKLKMKIRVDFHYLHISALHKES